MPAQTLAELIAAHQSTLQSVHAFVAGDADTTLVDGDPERAAGCDIGIALESGRLEFDNPLLAEIVRDLHSTFHGVGALVVSLHRVGPGAPEVGAYLAELDHISAQLTRLLQKARVRAG